MHFQSVNQTLQNFRRARANFLTSLVPGYSSRFTAHPVFNAFELDQVTRLLYRQYRKKGYCSANESKRYFSPHMFETKSRTFVLRRERKICGTMSIFPDSANGLPLEKLFAEEVEKFRDAGKHVAEVGLLALELQQSGKYSLRSIKKMTPLFVLIKLTIRYAIHAGITDLLIVVHPCHEPLYRFLGFQSFGENKSYDKVCGNPALPLRLDLTQLRTVWPQALQRYILDFPVSDRAFHPQLTESPKAFSELFGEAYQSFISANANKAAVPASNMTIQ